MPGDRTFLDTNIIIYAYDVSAGEKHEIAKKIYSYKQTINDLTIVNPFKDL